MNRLMLWAGLALAPLSGCDQSSPSNEKAGGDSREMSAPARAESEMSADASNGALEANAAPSSASSTDPAVSAAPAPTRLLVYHADLRVKVAALPAAAAQLEAAVKTSGGWMGSLTETRENGEWRQQTEIRVPPGKFGGLLGALSSLGTVEHKALNTADVTMQHADVTARLAAKRALEQEYLRLLKQGKKISDLLEVQEKLGEVREAIESTESQLKKLNDEVSYSTITVALYQPLVLDTPDAPVVSIGSRLVEAIFDGWRLIVGLLIGAISVWPLWLLGAGGWWLVRRWRRR